MGEPAVSPTYCPINGAYSFTYSVNDGTENMSECSSHTSEIADCPYGFGFNLNFRGCSFGNLGEHRTSMDYYRRILTLVIAITKTHRMPRPIGNVIPPLLPSFR